MQDTIKVTNATAGQSGSRRLSSLGLAFILTASAAIPAVAATSTQIVHNTPKFVASAQKLGPEDPGKVIEVSIWLNPHNKAELDALAKELYTPGSPNYRRFLSKNEFSARYAPTAAEAKTVQDFFTSNGLKIVSVGPNNFFVRARGTVAAVSSAFKVSLDNYSVKGETVRGNSKDPEVSAAVAPLAASIYGLDTLGYTHPIVSRASIRNPNGSKSILATGNKTNGTATGGVPALDFNSSCFTGKRTETMVSSPGNPAATAVYTGNGYTSNPATCGYTPANIQAAYNLTPLYKAGLDGTGQTIAIIDWCGSPTILQDANAFSAQFGLPKLTSANFSIINTPAPSFCSAPDPEINIDVEWAHAIAPGAAIDLVVPPSATFQDVDQGFFYAVNYQLGSVISGSYGSEEYFIPETILITEDLISETAAVLGISANFSSGDYGDFTEFGPPSVSAPADSPYATAVGGISLALKANNTIAWQSGWGTNINLLDAGGYIVDPPSEQGFFNFGAGGGPSGVFLKPSYQSKLPGATRQMPDISWLADPNTGAYIAISEPFSTPEIQYPVYGGTSLACPMFAALWAIANQAAGQPLGQAAPHLYSMPKGTITDIVPFGSLTNVKGTITDSAGTTSYSAASLADPLEGITVFYSALWDYPLNPGVTYLLTFGTDSGLTTAKGWDNVTGLGVPNGAAFISYFQP